METITRFFSLENTAIHILNYNLSWLELLATIFTLLNVFLAIRQHILNFPFALVSIILSFFLFYQSALYADAILQTYFFIVSIYGWWNWSKGSFIHNEIPATTLTLRKRLITFGMILLITPLTAILMIYLPSWLPRLFPQPTAYPFPDSFIMIASFAGQWLLAKKKVENWWCWIAVNAVAVIVYFLKDLKLFSFLYLALLVMAVAGLVQWNQKLKIKNA